jgi:glycosyltransferase involved in cell wall biosynthesis
MISIIIPAFNEESIIIPTIEKIRRVMKSSGYGQSEIIVVDDGSSDRTAELANSTGVKVKKHPHNIGYGRSLKDGIKASSCDLIVITDADQTYPLEKIPDLVKEYQKGFNMVVGARQGKNYNESFYKKILRIFLKKLVVFTAGRKIPDINSGLRIFSKKEILPYFDTLCDVFSFTTSLTLAYMMTGKYVKYIPISYQKREGKSKVRLFRDSLRTLQFIVEAIIYYNPIKIFIFFSLILLVLAVFNFSLSIIFAFISTSYIGTGCILLSLLMFGLGLLAVLLKQILLTKRSNTE